MGTENMVNLHNEILSKSNDIMKFKDKYGQNFKKQPGWGHPDLERQTW